MQSQVSADAKSSCGLRDVLLDEKCAPFSVGVRWGWIGIDNVPSTIRVCVWF